MPRFIPATPRCVGCRLRVPACVCGDAPRLALATRVVMIMHRIEWGKTSNTGHLARLALRDVDIRIHGLPHQRVSCDGLDSRSTLVLFPGHGATPLTSELLANVPRPVTLVIPDGNWNQTRHMMNRLPMLRAARTIRLEGAPLDVRCLRFNFHPDRRSTFEAMAQTLGLLEGGDVERRLLEFFQRILASKNDRD